MAKSSLISIIVPIYNVEPFLEECINSILNQTYQNLEIILVDDGSIDGSENMIDAYAKNHKHIRAIHQKHQGVSVARNVGVANASGEWISFIDPDDYVKKDFIESLYNIATKNKADISSCGFESFSEDGGILKKSPNWPSRPLSGHEAINESMAQKRPAYLPLNLFKTSLFKNEKIAFPVGQEYEDIAAKIKLLFYAKRVAFSNKKLYMYRIRQNSITGKKFTDSRYNDFLAAIKDVKNFLADSKDAEQFVYLNYFEFYSLITLLNYLAREPKTNTNKKYWSEIRKKLKKLYRKTKFPSTKSKMIYGISLIVSSSRKIYSIIYKRIKK